MALNFGPPAMTFEALGSLGKTFFDAQAAAQKRGIDQQKQQLLAGLGQGSGDFQKVGLGLIGAGDVQSGVAILGLAQKDKERQAEQDWIRQNAGSPAAPSAPTVPLGSDPRASLIQNESGGRWDAQNNATGAGGKVGHFGRLQFGQARLQEAAAAGAIPPGTTPQAFMQSPELQQAAERWHFSDIDQNIKANGFDRLVGQPINGVPVTVDGLRAVAHLGGVEGMKRFVQSGGRYNPADANGTRLSDYFARHGGGGRPASPAPVQVAENEADTQRIEAQMPGYGGAPVQVAQAPAQAGSPVADAPAPGAVPAQGFAIPGATPQQTQSIAADPKVQEARRRYLMAPERFRAAAKADLDLAVEDAKAAIVAGRDPENIREFMIAKQRGFTQARTPQEYAREKERPRAPVAVGPDTRLVNPDNGAIVFDGTQGQSKTARENAQREDEANKRGLTGPERDAYIFNGKLPSQSEKAPTEGQANAALYANRMREAEAVFAQPGVLEAGMSRLQQGFSKVPGVGNSIVSSEFQQVDQAQRNFINAVLRRESGAVISDPEFDNARKQYFPQPGDKPEVLAQKARNRQTAIQGIENAAGPAKRQQPEQRQAAQKPAPVIRDGARAQGPNGQIIVLRNGKWVSE